MEARAIQSTLGSGRLRGSTRKRFFDRLRWLKNKHRPEWVARQQIISPEFASEQRRRDRAEEMTYEQVGLTEKGRKYLAAKKKTAKKKKTASHKFTKKTAKAGRPKADAKCKVCNVTAARHK